MMRKIKGLKIVPEEVLMSKIYFIRNEKVMLDKDLALLYGVKAIRLREQVKRNLAKFPSHFMFQLTEKEMEFMVSQNAIPSRSHVGGTLPLVFTEHGVLMLANILKSDQAIKVSIRIIELFVKLRQLLLSHSDLKLEIERIKKKIDIQDRNIKVVFEYIEELLVQKSKPRKKVGFNIPTKGIKTKVKKR